MQLGGNGRRSHKPDRVIQVHHQPSRGEEQLEAQLAHNQTDVGSCPTPALFLGELDRFVGNHAGFV